MENTILVILGVLVLFFLFFIYKKIDQGKGPDDAGAKYAVLLDKFDTLAKSTEDLRANLNKSQIDLSEKLTNKQNTSEKEIKSDLSKLNESLAVIVTAQRELNDLKTSVIDFKNLFNNQTTRGRLGNDSLKAIVSDVLNKRYFKMEHTLSNGKRVDCFLFLGEPHECVAIDSKFAWENYTKLVTEKDEQLKKVHSKNFIDDINKHIKDISDKYIIDKETAPFALMYVASEGVYQAIMNSDKEFTKLAREKNVVIVSPNTIFGFLKTYRLFIDNKEMSEKADTIQKEFGKIYEEIFRFAERFSAIDKRNTQLTEDFRKLQISVDQITRRSERVKNLEFDKKTGIEK
jgi:DNA recombination protein RmuC